MLVFQSISGGNVSFLFSSGKNKASSTSRASLLLWNGYTGCIIIIQAVSFTAAQGFHVFVAPQVVIDPHVYWFMREGRFHTVLHIFSLCLAPERTVDDSMLTCLCVVSMYVQWGHFVSSCSRTYPHSETTVLWPLSMSSRVSAEQRDLNWVRI